MKKVLALLLAVLVVIGMFAGCSSVQQTPDTSDTTDTTETTDTTPATSTDNKEETPATPVEEDHEPVTLHYYVQGTPTQSDMEKVHAAVNELIQTIYPWMTIEFHVSTGADYATHMALAQASGDPIDVVSTFGLDYQTEISLGSYLDITDMLDNYPALMSSLPDFAYGFGQKDGRTYGFPNWQQSNYANNAIAVEKEYADKYGLDIDALTEKMQATEFFNSEIYDMLFDYITAAREDGDESVFFNPGNTLWGTVSRGYEQVTGPFYYAWSDGECKLVNLYETDAVKDYLVALQKFRDAGYLPEDFASNYGSYVSKSGVQDGNHSLLFSDNAYVPNFPMLRKNAWGADLYFVAGNKSNDEYYIGYNYAAGLTCVDVTSEHPEEALMFIELLYTNEEVQNMLVYGLEGEHYTWNDDGTITTLDYDSGSAPADAPYGMMKFVIGNSALTWINQSFDQDMYDWSFKSLAETGTPSNLIGFAPDTSKISSKLSQINAVVSEYSGTLYRGVDNWEEVYAEFLDKLDAAGIDTVQEVLQAQIDSFLANK